MTAVNLNRAIRGPVTAVPVVAGKGVRIVPDVENNRFVVEADETVLWEGDFKMGDSAISLAETNLNFEFIEFTFKASGQTQKLTSGNKTFVITNSIVTADAKPKMAYITLTTNGTSVTYVRNRVLQGSDSYSDVSDADTHIVKIVGINRVSST